MANITKRGNAYLITVSCGYAVDGKQIKQFKTWKPDESMTVKQVEKELQKQALKFEEECKQGQITAVVKFEEFARQWFTEYAEKKLKLQTIRGYHNLEPRIYKAIGYMRMDKINTRTLQKFINDISDENNPEGRTYLGKKLSAKTIKLHLSLISNIFNYAIKQQMISNNPCINVTLPAPDKKECEIYTVEEAQKLLTLLSKEHENELKHVLFFSMAMFTGFRRGEILGLEWKDFDFYSKIVTVCRTSNYYEKVGTYTDTPKTKKSQRCLRLNDDLIALVLKFRDWQNKERERLGSKWVETDRLFTQWNGLPMGHNSPQLFFKRFCKNNGMRYVNVHSWRHFFASALINSGLDVVSVQNCLGHVSPLVTLGTYSHAFNKANARATEAISSTIRLVN
jgi:integrase